MREYFPGPAVESDAEIAAYIEQHVSTWFHPGGSCRMGVDEAAVVDPQLRVRGTTGLRVADASIMPELVSVNTNAASTMIGWKAAGHVLGVDPHDERSTHDPQGLHPAPQARRAATSTSTATRRSGPRWWPRSRRAASRS